MQKSYRKFIGYEVENTNLTLKELSDLSKAEITIILSKLTSFSKSEAFPNKYYEDYGAIYKGLGRFRIDDFRIYTLKIAPNVYLILHILRRKHEKFLIM